MKSMFRLCIVSSVFLLSSAHATPTVEGSVGIGNGKIQDVNETVFRRTMSNVTFTVLPAWNFGSFAVGPFAEYKILYQMTEVETINNQNSKGSWYVLGLGGNYAYEKWLFSGSLNILGEYSLANRTGSNKSVSYRRPYGLRIGGSREIDHGIGAGVFGSFAQFTEVKVGKDTFSINSNKLTVWDLSIALTYSI